MFELRLADVGDGNIQLQQRTRELVMDASGAFCGLSEWSDWSAVPIVHGKDVTRPVVDVFTTRT